MYYNRFVIYVVFDIGICSILFCTFLNGIFFGHLKNARKIQTDFYFEFLFLINFINIGIYILQYSIQCNFNFSFFAFKNVFFSIIIIIDFYICNHKNCTL